MSMTGHGQPLADAPEVIRAYFQAINAEDWQTLAAVFRDEAVVHPPGVEPISGSAAIVSWYQAVFRRFPDHLDRPVHAIISADRVNVAVEIDFSGTTREGRSFQLRAVDHFDLGDDKILAMRSWLDTAAFAAATTPPRAQEET